MKVNFTIFSTFYIFEIFCNVKFNINKMKWKKRIGRLWDIGEGAEMFPVSWEGGHVSLLKSEGERQQRYPL